MPCSFGTAGWVASAAAALAATPVVVCDLARLKRLDQTPASVGSGGRVVRSVTNRERPAVERCHRPTLRLALLTALAVCVDGERSGVRRLVITTRVCVEVRDGVTDLFAGPLVEVRVVDLRCVPCL